MAFDSNNAFIELNRAVISHRGINIICCNKGKIMLDKEDKNLTIHASSLSEVLKIMDKEGCADYSKLDMGCLNQMFQDGYRIHLYGEYIPLNDEDDLTEMLMHLDLFDKNGELEYRGISWGGSKSLFFDANDYAVKKDVVSEFCSGE